MEFFALIAFSLIFPCAIYWFLLKRTSISRYSVIGLAILLIAMAGIDVYLLQTLSDMTKATPSKFDDQLFASGLSIALYILPAVFAGLGVNLLSHVLIDHLHKAETRHAREARDKDQSS
jgi:uncharacterized metal-binding protein